MGILRALRAAYATLEFDLNLNRATGSMAPDSRKRLSVRQLGAPPEIGGDNERRCQEQKEVRSSRLRRRTQEIQTGNLMRRPHIPPDGVARFKRLAGSTPDAKREGKRWHKKG